ncbi:MAG TPA: alcohol dehydrogenase-like regulatory protein ErcA [Chitinispirillaceae bacterium]|nr:alcohol dehydrogenase-like regulatory protein ErcA [Chitinispirillaceae bacterium]
MEPRKFVIPEFVLGEGALSLAGQYAGNFGAKKAFLVTDPGVIESGWAKKVQMSIEKAGLHYVIFSDISSNPRDTEVMAGAEKYLQEQCDVIIAVGGGSPIDCAKGIGIVASNNEQILKFEGVDQVAIPIPPLICISTTAGSSADISQFAIITDTVRKVKILIISKAIVPDVALIDPVTTTTLPANVTAYSGMDAFVHAIEACVSTANSMVTDLHALEAIRIIRKNLRNAIEYPGDMNYRNSMVSGCLFAGIAFSNASLGLVHAMAHSLGGYYDLVHGLCNGILLDYVCEFNFESASEQYFRIGEALGLDLNRLSYDQKKDKILEDLIAFKKDTGIIQSLSDAGVKRDDIPLLARHVLSDPCLVTNPKEPSLKDIEIIYERAL